MCLSQARQLSQPHSCFLPFTGGNVSSSTSLQPSTKEIHNKKIQGLFCFATKLLVAVRRQTCAFIDLFIYFTFQQLISLPWP